MKTIDIDERVVNLVPEVFKTLPANGVFSLTKTENTRTGFYYVGSGDTVTGPLSIVCICDKPGVKVLNTKADFNNFENRSAYIRTSPIVEVLDTTDTIITFRTEGGVYKLEKMR